MTGTNGALGGQALSSGGSQAVTVTVLDHAAAAFAGGSGTLNLSFGTVQRGSGTQSLQYQIENLSAAFRAGLDLDSVSVVSNPAGVFSTDAAPFADLVPGYTSNPFDLVLNTSQTGQFSGIYQFNLSDEKDLSGHAGQQTLTLDVTANVVRGSVNGLWITNGGGDWSGSGNWSGGSVPGAPQDTAVFAASLGGGSAAVNLDIPVSLAGLAFSTTGGDRYVISSSSGMTMTLANTAGATTIDNGGSNAIAAALYARKQSRRQRYARQRPDDHCQHQRERRQPVAVAHRRRHARPQRIERLLRRHDCRIGHTGRGQQRGDRGRDGLVRRVGFVGVPHGGSSSRAEHAGARAGHVALAAVGAAGLLAYAWRRRKAL